MHVDPARVRVIRGTGADAAPRPGSPFTVGYFGAVIPSKGVFVLAEVAALLGDDASRSSSTAQVRARDDRRARAPEPRAPRRSPVPTAPRICPHRMARVHAVAVPSLWPETFSIVVREAWAHRRPVLASATGALVEAAGPGQRPGRPRPLRRRRRLGRGDPAALDRSRPGTPSSPVRTSRSRSTTMLSAIEACYTRAREPAPRPRFHPRLRAGRRAGTAERGDRGHQACRDSEGPRHRHRRRRLRLRGLPRDDRGGRPAGRSSSSRGTGSFIPLEPTNPAQSPVSWATLTTGLNPGRTGINDFLRREFREDGGISAELALSKIATRRRLRVRRQAAGLRRPRVRRHRRPSWCVVVSGVRGVAVAARSRSCVVAAFVAVVWLAEPVEPSSSGRGDPRLRAARSGQCARRRRRSGSALDAAGIPTMSVLAPMAFPAPQLEARPPVSAASASPTRWERPARTPTYRRGAGSRRARRSRRRAAG